MKQEPKKTVTDYLASLTWDGVPRIERWLIDYAGAPDTPYVRAVSRIVLIAAVRRIRKPGAKYDEMLILEGPQGTGKSSALRVLAVNEDWFTDDLPLGSDMRRFMESTAGKWIVEAGELKSMSRSDINGLKACLARQYDEARLAYQHENTRVARQFVIIGTINETEGYLRDTTGNRRFWPVRIQRFDLSRLRADRDQLWAEAAAAEQTGASIRLDPGLYADAVVEREARLRGDAPVVAAAEATVTGAALCAAATEAVEDQEEYAYVVLDDRWGATFSSQSLDTACAFVSAQLREQVAKIAVLNPSSFRIVRVKAG